MNGQQRMVKITIIDGTNLLAKDIGGTSDPYCRVKCCGVELFKTKVVKKDLNPKWNESFVVD